jgi:hypothetical protein
LASGSTTTTTAPASSAPPTSGPPVTGGGDLGANVIVFDPSMSSTSIQSTLDQVFATQETNQLGTQRYALLFKPGSYSNLNAQLGFYTSIAGLGQNPGVRAVASHQQFGHHLGRRQHPGTSMPLSQFYVAHPSDTAATINNALAHGLNLLQKYNVIWNGNGGKTIFFQNELPYDPPSTSVVRTTWSATRNRPVPGGSASAGHSRPSSRYQTSIRSPGRRRAGRPASAGR